MLPRGGVGECSPLKNIKGGTKEKSAEVYPPGKFRRQKISKGGLRKNLTPPPRILEIFRINPPWREVVWASLMINHCLTVELKLEKQILNF